MEGSGHLQDPSALCYGNNFWHPLNRRLCEPHGWSECFGEEKFTVHKRRVTGSVQQATFFTSGEQLSVNLLKLKDKNRIPSLSIFHICSNNCTLYDKPSELSVSTHRSLFYLSNSAQHTRIWRNI